MKKPIQGAAGSGGSVLSNKETYTYYKNLDYIKQMKYQHIVFNKKRKI
jgi:hypothetical protein